MYGRWPLSLSVCNTASSTASCEKSPKFTQNLPEDTKWITVAVKVRHPNVEEIINLDFKIMAQLAHCLDVFPSLRSLRLGESMSQFSSSIAAQTSLFQEGKHLQKVSSQLRLLIEFIFDSSPPICTPVQPILRSQPVGRRGISRAHIPVGECAH